MPESNQYERTTFTNLKVHQPVNFRACYARQRWIWWSHCGGAADKGYRNANANKTDNAIISLPEAPNRHHDYAIYKGSPITSTRMVLANLHADEQTVSVSIIPHTLGENNFRFCPYWYGS